MRVCMCACVYVFIVHPAYTNIVCDEVMFAYVSMCVCVYACMHVCMCV
jgi:hypothetical protein